MNTNNNNKPDHLRQTIGDYADHLRKAELEDMRAASYREQAAKQSESTEAHRLSAWADHHAAEAQRLRGVGKDRYTRNLYRSWVFWAITIGMGLALASLLIAADKG